MREQTSKYAVTGVTAAESRLGGGGDTGASPLC